MISLMPESSNENIISLKPKMEQKKRIIIVGGSLAGLAVARSLLCHQTSCEIIILEQHTCVPSDRYGITLQPNGLRGLQKLGLLNEALERGVKLKAFEVISADNGHATRLELSHLPGEINYAVGLLPSQLYGLLLKSLRQNVQILQGHHLVDIIRHEDKKQVITQRTDGHEFHFMADLVIGADGINSKVRNYVVQKESRQPTNESYQIILGTSLPNIDCVQQYIAPGKLLGIVPIGSSHTFIFWFHQRHQCQTIRQQPIEKFKQELITFAPILANALQTLENWEQVFSTTVTLTQSKKWISDGIALVGDAVHATTPSLAQGANMALLDAVCLGEQLAPWLLDEQTKSIEHLLKQGLHQYQKLRQPQAFNQYRLGKFIVWSTPIQARWFVAAKLGLLNQLSNFAFLQRLILEKITGVSI